jgi:hypothetical protein
MRFLAALSLHTQVLDAEQLSGVFKDSLSAAILLKVLHRALAGLGAASDAAAASVAEREQLLALLEGFTRVPRFDMNVMFLSGKDKKGAAPLPATNKLRIEITGGTGLGSDQCQFRTPYTANRQNFSG